MPHPLTRRGLLALVALAATAACAAPTKTGPTKVAMNKFKTTKSGLQYAVLKPGAGAVAKAGDHVFVHYTGWLKSNGKKFDSSRDRNEPIDFPLGAGRVIKGWDEGVAGMKIGEQRQLVIPPSLGYGDRAMGGDVIPANSTLVFDVELVKIAK
jgi:FKBP-type peptidyl-prolyl cis-trans isomerase FkpA